MTLTLFGLPLPPSINEAYINRGACRGGPGRIKSRVYRAFEADMFEWKLKHRAAVESAAALAANALWLQVDLCFCYPRSRVITKDGRPKRHDVDNRVKVMNDALATVLNFNDCKIAGQTIEKCETTGSVAYVTATLIVRCQLRVMPSGPTENEKRDK